MVKRKREVSKHTKGIWSVEGKFVQWSLTILVVTLFGRQLVATMQ